MTREVTTQKYNYRSRDVVIDMITSTISYLSSSRTVDCSEHCAVRPCP